MEPEGSVPRYSREGLFFYAHFTEVTDIRKLKKYTPTPFMAKRSHYDKALADYAVSFIQCLCHTKGTWAGKPFELIDWQERIIRDLSLFSCFTGICYADLKSLAWKQGDPADDRPGSGDAQGETGRTLRGIGNRCASLWRQGAVAFNRLAVVKYRGLRYEGATHCFVDSHIPSSARNRGTGISGLFRLSDIRWKKRLN